MNIAFFCSTPYQIFNAIHIKRTSYLLDCADMYILNQFHNCYTLASNVRMSKVFSDVYIIEDGDFDYTYSLPAIQRYMKKIADFSNAKSTIARFMPTNITYDKVFYTFPNMIIELACFHYINLNPKVKFAMFEDGFSSYSDGLIGISKSKRFFLNTFNRNQLLPENIEMLLYAPSLFCQSDKSVTYLNKQIPKIDSENDIFIQLVNNVFDYNKSNDIHENMIFFEQPYEDKSINIAIRNTFDTIRNCVPNAELCVKLHPRGRIELYEDIPKYQAFGIPAEVLYLNMENIEGKTLISSISTACLSPKLIFDKEPRLILLYKYLKLNELGIISNSLVEFVEKVIRTYHDPNRIMIPTNDDELIECLKNGK